MNQYAYVTFLIKNDSYVPGALVFAYSIKKQETIADLICFVSNDISEEGINSLKLIYDFVVNTDQIQVKNKRKQTRQDVELLFNRFNALLLEDSSITGKKYNKIILADCDVLPINDWDLLFDLNAPAGIINEKKEHCMEYDETGKFIIPESYYTEGKWIWHKIYDPICPPGSLIPKEITDRVNYDSTNMGVNAAIYLFEPSISLYNDILEDLKTEETANKINNFNWPEMQYITQKLSGKWNNVDIKYASFNGYPDLTKINGIHFAGLKPWSFKNKSIKVFGRYDDFKLWYEVYLYMINEYNELLKNRKLKKLNDIITDFTSDEKYKFYLHYLPNLKHFFN